MGRINIIVAHGNKRAIGKDNKLLWNLPADMKRFKEITTGHTVVMGRKTYESIGKPLPNRTNVVITSNPESIESEEVISGELPFIKDLIMNGTLGKEIFIIGGEQVYKEFLPIAKRLYITKVIGDFPEADTFFPDYQLIDFLQGYEVIDMGINKADEQNKYTTVFCSYEKS